MMVRFNIFLTCHLTVRLRRVEYPEILQGRTGCPATSIRKHELREFARLVESGSITPLMDKVFPLEKVRDALAYSESGRATGKVVIKVV